MYLTEYLNTIWNFPTGLVLHLLLDHLMERLLDLLLYSLLTLLLNIANTSTFVCKAIPQFPKPVEHFASNSVLINYSLPRILFTFLNTLNNLLLDFRQRTHPILTLITSQTMAKKSIFRMENAWKLKLTCRIIAPSVLRCGPVIAHCHVAMFGSERGHYFKSARYTRVSTTHGRRSLW